MNRREFIETSAGAMGAAMLPLSESPRVQAATRPIGIQVGAVSFLDEGTDRVLDTLVGDRRCRHAVPRDVHLRPRHRRTAAPRQRAARSRQAGVRRQLSRRQLRDAAPAVLQEHAILPQKAPDHPDYDVIADVLPRAQKRGMKVICWFEDVFRNDVPGIDKAFEVDVHGQPAARVCYRNPNTLNFWLGLTEDFLRSYHCRRPDVRQRAAGPAERSPRREPRRRRRARQRSGASARTASKPRRRKASTPSARGRAISRSKRWVGGLKSGQRPVDGAFVTFWRILVEYPEVLAWERLWNEGLRDTYRAMYRKAHEIAPHEADGLAHLAHQLVRAVLSRRTGLRGCSRATRTF